jgi:cell division protein FtsN
MARLAARDYKHGPRRSSSEPLSLRDYRQFGLGLAIGLAIAAYVWVQSQPKEEDLKPVADLVEAAEVPSAQEPDPAEQYDFYDLLPKYEVVVQEADRNPRRDQPSVAISKPGAYVLQVTSSRNRADAERLRDRLAKQGINATIQHVTIDDKEWHRVRVGPSRDLKYINQMRELLRAADQTFIVYEVGE